MAKYKILFGIMVLWLVVSLTLGRLEFLRQQEKPQNVMTVEYYRYYTITYYNGKLDLINVDLERYPAMYCDSWDDNNEEGQTCLLAGDDTMNEFLEMVGQK